MEWYCIHTKPKKEAQVAEFCRRMLGLETYYPRLRTQRTVRGKKQHVTGPLFPRYLFCRFDPRDSYRAVRYAPDAIDVVHAGDYPAEVSATLIHELKQWAGDSIDLVALRPVLQPGDLVEVVNGPLRGLPAVILHTDSERDRVAILLTFLQCGAQATVRPTELKRIA